MDLPRVDPVGIAETPAGFAQSPRVHSRGARFDAALLLGVFATTVVATTVGSLATYCLTTWAGLPLPPS